MCVYATRASLRLPRLLCLHDTPREHYGPPLGSLSDLHVMYESADGSRPLVSFIAWWCRVAAAGALISYHICTIGILWSSEIIVMLLL